MASELPQLTLYDYLINSRNRGLSSLSPISLAFTDPQNMTNPDQDSSERSDPRDRIILLNTQTQRVVMLEGSPSGVNALLRDLTSKDGPPAASKASIEAMGVVETKEGDECVICMEEFVCELAKQMPCKHIFHGECVEKWLKINGSCPVCRYKMPVDDDNEFNQKNLIGSDDEGEGRREIWLTFTLSNNNNSVGRTSGDTDQTATNDSDETEIHDSDDETEMQGLD